MGVLDWRRFFQLRYSWRKYAEIFQAGLCRQVTGSNVIPVKTWPAKSLPSDIGLEYGVPAVTQIQTKDFAYLPEIKHYLGIPREILQDRMLV